jgi:hypothetical protein
MFKLKLKTDNAAFSDGDGPAEVARILREVAKGLETYGTRDGAIHDYNGNTVGTFTLTGV